MDSTASIIQNSESEEPSRLARTRKRAQDCSKALDENPKPVKRRKTATSAKQLTSRTGTSSSRRKQGLLSALPSMPLDVLYEIFGHLLPGDLVNLGRVNKSFRQVLLSRDSKSLWKNSFKEQTHMPPCPEDMAEPAWANLLFGGSNCSICAGKTGGYKIFYELRRRLCKPCLEAHLETFDNEISSTRIAKLLGVDVWKLFDFLPCVMARTRAYRQEMYHWWREDMVQLRTELEHLRITHGDDQAFMAAVEAWKATRLAIMNLRNEHLSLCNRIEYERANDRTAELDKIRDDRLIDISRRLKEAGYEDVDIRNNQIISHREVTAPKPMTDRVWKRVSPILEAIVKNIRSRRLAHEKNIRRQKREDCFKEEYITFLTELDTKSDVSFVPRETEIVHFSAVAALLEEDAEGSEEKIGSFVSSALPSLLKDWIGRRKHLLRSSIPPEWTTPQSAGSLTWKATVADGTMDGNPRPIKICRYLQDFDLAAYVFRCAHEAKAYEQMAHFGLDALAHSCGREESRVLQPCEKGRAVVLQLLELVGYDPSCTTPLDMDKSNHLFVCTECSPLSNTDPDDAPMPMPWRHCPRHSLKKHDGKPAWRRLTETERALVRIHGRSPHDVDTNWGCCHCSEHLVRLHQQLDMHSLALTLWFTHAEMVHHLASEHDVHTPIEGQDMFYNRAYLRSAPLYLPLASAETPGKAATLRGEHVRKPGGTLERDRSRWKGLKLEVDGSQRGLMEGESRSAH
ncbi:hypothetical protein OF83DRAFT_1118885 [Amylostereum chailletii]|nr:hypothetical protein OF83DRAFT_1118885 [Amylostereum chailletii]